ncbi:MAG TPA: hypothetical protein VGR00_01530, partial [Thermoanaerobaculia bacterium]|nr:hypothetical protein [Thermoanaerobaculia bacterium]
IQPPSRALLSLLLLAYLAAIGPLDYLVLKRFRRLSLTWATYPALVLLFSFGAYAAATATKSLDNLRYVAVRDLLPESGVYHEEIDSSLFMGHGGRFRFGVRPASGLALPVSFGDDDPYGRWQPRVARPGLEGSYLEGEGAADVELPKWTPLLTRVVREVPAAAGARVDAALTVSSDRVSGEVVPRLGLERDLDDAWILVRTEGMLVAFPLGAQRDGAPSTLKGNTGTPLGKLTETSRFQNLVLAASARRVAAYDGTGHPPDPQRDRDDYSPLLLAGGALYVGHARGAPTAVGVEGGRPDVAGDLFVRVPIPPEAIQR